MRELQLHALVGPTGPACATGKSPKLVIWPFSEIFIIFLHRLNIQGTKNKELEQKLDTLINLTVNIWILDRLIRFLVARILLFLKNIWLKLSETFILVKYYTVKSIYENKTKKNYFVILFVSFNSLNASFLFILNP